MKHLIERMEYQYLTSRGMEFPNSLEGDLLKVCYEIFIKDKPPTWEEVINAWKMCGYNLHKKTDNNLMFQLGSTCLYSFDIYANGKIKISDSIHYLRKDELNAINLSIRYLE